MQLKSFRVQNFRSINDSGEIDATARTALVGRNESGKTNLLLALTSLNPPDRKTVDLSEVKDFPNDRPLTDFSKYTPVVSTTWILTEYEQEELQSIFPELKALS